MPLPKLFKTKGKQREQSAVSSRHPMDAILSREFTQLTCRAQSPADLLDIVGYPRIQNASSPNLSTPAAEPVRKQQRPAVGPRRASFHSFSPTTNRPKYLRVASKASSTPPLQMPTPQRKVPPTEQILQSDSWADKTLDEEEAAEDPRVMSRAPEEMLPPPPPQEHYHQSEIKDLYDKLLMYHQEHQVWVKRENQHRMREEWMYKQLQETRAQLKRLQLVAYHNRPIIDEAFCGDETSDAEEKDRQRTNQGRRQHRVPETYYHGDRYCCEDDDNDDDESSGYISEEEGEEQEEEEEEEMARRRRWARRQHPAYYFYGPAARPYSAAYQHAMEHRIPYYYYGYQQRAPLRRQRSRKSSDGSVRSVPLLRHGNPRNVEFSTGEGPPYGWPSASRRSTTFL